MKRCTLLLPAFWIVVAAALFSSAMNAPIHLDEGHYVMAARLGEQGQVIYRDFAYLQTPYYPLLTASLFDLTRSDHYLLVTRATTCGFLLLACGFMYATTRRIVGPRSPLAPCSVVLLFAGNHVIRLRMGLATNDMMAVALALAGACCVLTLLGVGPTARRPGVRAFAAGLLFAAATGTKGYCASLAAVSGVAVFVVDWQAPLSGKMKRLAAYAAGGILGAAPVLWCFARAPGAFWLDNVTYHVVNAAWRVQTHHPQVSLRGKLHVITQTFTTPTAVMLVMLAVAVFALAAAHGREAGERWRALFPPAVVYLLALVVAALVAVLPLTPLWNHYFMLPVPFALLAGVVWYDQMLARAPRATRQAWAAVAAIVVLAHAAHVAAPLRRLAKPRLWVTTWAHGEGQKVRRAVVAAGGERAAVEGKVATIYPLPVAEGGLRGYPEFASGAFVYRVGDLLSAEDRRAVVGTSPETVTDLLERDPPVAILVNVNLVHDREHHLEDPLIYYAEAYGYRKVDARLDPGTLYLRPNLVPPDRREQVHPPR